MASLTKLRRRLHRWHRYDNRWRAARINLGIKVPPGLIRAARAVEAEEDRRFWEEAPEIWLGGSAGEAALTRDALGDDRPSCTLRPPPEGSSCYCTRRPGCQSIMRDLCDDCGDPACFGDCWGEPEPVRPVEAITVTGGVL